MKMNGTRAGGGKLGAVWSIGGEEGTMSAYNKQQKQQMKMKKEK